ncbi:MAG TPA: hypothetical protein VFF72_01440 [Caldimonas sp.]|nr:hypothetical protein [Caldimonas sp.]
MGASIADPGKESLRIEAIDGDAEMNEDDEDLTAELAEAAEQAAASVSRLTAVLRRIELANRLRQLQRIEELETVQAALGVRTRESKMAGALIARARGGARPG